MSNIIESFRNLEFLDWIFYLIGGLMIIYSLFAVEAKKVFDSILALSAVSLLSVLLFIVLKAPDVAITEAAVGSGLASAVMIFALFRMKAGEKK
ncbi:Na(+)/H(+) antiporter subunit B [Fervidobacterium islandicum]|uniref:Na(+)/H(+) antiporter subunit B n=1 Tax=Fervidobacterium islandicum TaxID=2423 RepID=UPI003A7536EB